MSMWLPGLGGPLERNWDFILSEVGPEVTERLDMFANGYRPFRNNAEPAFSCNRPFNVGNSSCTAKKLKIIELEVLNMKFKLIILTFLGILTAPAFGQTDNIVERSFACNINDGYTMRDVG